MDKAGAESWLVPLEMHAHLMAVLAEDEVRDARQHVYVRHLHRCLSQVSKRDDAAGVL
jgi:hypothetical protein